MKFIFTMIAVLVVLLTQAQEFICAGDPSMKSLNATRLQSTSNIGNYNLNDMNTWIPYCDGNPLKNPPETFINVTFHVFLDDGGNGSRYADNNDSKRKLIKLLSEVNDRYSGKRVIENGGPSDKVPGVNELHDYDTKIRFTLGDNNERVYFYRSTEMSHLKDELVPDAGTLLYNYILKTYPSRLQIGINVFFIASSYQAKVKEIIVTNWGAGYTQQPTIELIKPNGEPLKNTYCKAKIISGKIARIFVEQSGIMNGYETPTVRITGGGGSGATAKVNKLEGGAAAFANMPVFYNDLNSYVVMFNTIPTDNPDIESASATVLAHELGHNLDLNHTYCGGGSSAVGCTEMKGKHTCKYGHEYDDSEYLSDIFGPCGESSTFPHIGEWIDPYTYSGPNDKKITNNVMGGTSSQVYISPMQAGQMHRAIATKSVGKYVAKNTHSNIPVVIRQKERWDYNFVRLFHDIQIKKNGYLTLEADYEFNHNCSIEIEDGGVLYLENTYNMELGSTNKIIVKKGGTLVIGGNLVVSESGLIEIQEGGYLCIRKDANVTLRDYLSLIKFNAGAKSGVNTIVMNTPGANSYYTSASAIKYNGNGAIATYNSNKYIQNQTISNSSYISGNNIYAGNSVTTTKPKGDVIVKSGCNLILDAENDLLLDKGVVVELGATLETK